MSILTDLKERLVDSNCRVPGVGKELDVGVVEGCVPCKQFTS